MLDSVIPPEDRFTEDVKFDFTHPEVDFIRQGLKRYIVGQDRAIDATIDALTRYYAGLKRPEHPIAAFMFPGPSGSGKTYFAKVLSSLFLGVEPKEEEYHATIINCADFYERHMIARLVGAPPGYLGHYNPGDQRYGGTEPLLMQSEIDKYDFRIVADMINGELNRIFEVLHPMSKSEGERFSEFADTLTKAVKRRYKPRAVIIFDEVERADPKLWDVLLHIIGEGQLQLQMGGGGESVTSFRNAVIIMTSNIGERALAQYLRAGNKAAMGFSLGADTQAPQKTDEEVYKIVREAARKTFIAPLLARIGSGFIPFRPLTQNNLVAILELALGRLQKLYDGTNLQRPVVKLRFTRELKVWLVERGTDVEYGARDLEDKIQEYIVDKLLGRAELAGDLLSGDEVLFYLKKGQKPDGSDARPHMRRLPRSRATQLFAPTPQNVRSGLEKIQRYINDQGDSFQKKIEKRRKSASSRAPSSAPQELSPGGNPRGPNAFLVSEPRRGGKKPETLFADFNASVIRPSARWLSRFISGRK